MEKTREELEKIIKEVFGIDFKAELSPAPENIDADYSSNVPLKLAKELHKAPMDIAEELKAKMDGATVSAPGFLNFKLTDDSLNKAIDELSENFEETVSSNEYTNQTII